MPNRTRKRNWEYIKEIFTLLQDKEDGLQVKDRWIQVVNATVS